MADMHINRIKRYTVQHKLLCNSH